MGAHLDRLRDIVALSVLRHVQTPEGVQKYGLPLGSAITADMLHQNGYRGAANALAPAPKSAKPVKRVSPKPGAKVTVPQKGMPQKGTTPQVGGPKTITNRPVPVSGFNQPDHLQPVTAPMDVPKGPIPGIDIPHALTTKRNTVGMHAVADDDKDIRANFAKLAGRPIPPAWTEVFLANDPHTAKVLAIGRDAKGRAVSMPSASAMEAGAADKFDRVKEVAKVMPRLDEVLKRDAANDDTAAATFVMRRMGIRVGSETDTKSKVKAYGTTTLQAQHVKVTGNNVEFTFTGKKGVNIHLVQENDPELAKVIKKQLAGKGPQDKLFDTTPEKTISYIRSATGNPKMKNHDLRTHLANVEALKAIRDYGNVAPQSKADFNRMRNEVGDVVSAKLGNNRTEAIKSYINPDVWLTWSPNGEWL